MRTLGLLSLFAVAACSGPAENKVDEAAILLQAGQWELTTEILKPEGAAKPTTLVSCLKAEDVEEPNVTMFSGTEGSCKFDNIYMSNGRLVAKISCPQKDGSSYVMTSIDGNYTATTIDAKVGVAKFLDGVGANLEGKLSGKRVGECPAELPAAK